jgi:hypothetical protein
MTKGQFQFNLCYINFVQKEINLRKKFLFHVITDLQCELISRSIYLNSHIHYHTKTRF